MCKLKVFLISALLIIVAGCASNSAAVVDFDLNPEIDTSQYKSFAWMKETKILVSSEDLNPVMKVRIDREIEAAFIAKGYKLAADPESADFVISYTVGSRDKIKVDSYPTTYHGGFGWGRRYHGGYAGMSMGTETRVRNYTEGRLALDIYDVKTHQPAWHGSAVKRISTSDKENYELTIKTIVNQVISQFK